MKLILLSILSILLCSCKDIPVKFNNNPGITDAEHLNNVAPALTEEQQSAFDALNTLQVNTDKQNHLYSTFANMEHPCFPADTSFFITQSELLMIMQEFVSRHCTNLPIDQRNKLAGVAVKTQNNFQVFHCIDISELKDYSNGVPFRGTWIMPNILGRRDLILVWS